MSEELAPQPWPDPATAHAVQVNDLVKSYGPVRAVAGLTFTAGAGEVTAVLGPNGAGKTTTLEICEGFRTPDAGSVWVLGRRPRADRALASRVGVMLQEGGVYGSVSARQALRHTAALFAHPLPVAALLDRLGLAVAQDTPFRRLSGGQQRRVALALALVGRPDLVFLDEPSAGLDPQARRAVAQLIDELRQAGVSVVLTTHDMAEAESLADHVVIVDAGRVVAAGSPRALVDAGLPGRGVVEFASAPGLDVAALGARLGAGQELVEVTPGRYELTGAVGATTVTLVSEWCADQGTAPDQLVLRPRTLEDVFLELTGRELRP